MRKEWLVFIDESGHTTENNKPFNKMKTKPSKQIYGNLFIEKETYKKIIKKLIDFHFEVDKFGPFHFFFF